MSYGRTVHAISENILPAQPLREGQKSAAEVTGFILQLQALMPDYLRRPIVLLTYYFNAEPYLFTGRPFHKLPPERQRRCLLAWKQSRLRVKQDFVRFYESLAIFGWAGEAYD